MTHVASLQQSHATAIEAVMFRAVCELRMLTGPNIDYAGFMTSARDMLQRRLEGQRPDPKFDRERRRIESDARSSLSDDPQNVAFWVHVLTQAPLIFINGRDDSKAELLDEIMEAEKPLDKEVRIQELAGMLGHSKSRY